MKKNSYEIFKSEVELISLNHQVFVRSDVDSLDVISNKAFELLKKLKSIED